MRLVENKTEEQKGSPRTKLGTLQHTGFFSVVWKILGTRTLQQTGFFSVVWEILGTRTLQHTGFFSVNFLRAYTIYCLRRILQLTRFTIVYSNKKTTIFLFALLLPSREVWDIEVSAGGRYLVPWLAADLSIGWLVNRLVAWQGSIGGHSHRVKFLS